MQFTPGLTTGRAEVGNFGHLRVTRLAPSARNLQHPPPMPKSLLFLILLLLLVAAPVIYIAATTPLGLEELQLGRSSRAEALLRLVPSDAADVAFLPRAGAAVRAIQNHAALRNAFGDDALSSPFLPFLLGRSDVVVWRGAEARGAVARLDPVRAMLLRVYMMRGGDGLSVASSGGVTIVTSGTAAAPDASRAAEWIALAPFLRGHVFVISTASSRLGFPPIARPSLTAMMLDGRSIRTRSHAAHRDAPPAGDLSRFRLPSAARIAASVNECPGALKSIRRLIPFDVCRVFAHGGLVAIYGVDTGRLIPRLQGLLVVPASSVPADLLAATAAPEERRRVGDVEILRKRLSGATFEIARRGDDLLIGLDKTGIESYLADTLLDPPAKSGNAQWVVRVRPDELNRVLTAIEKRKELSLLAPEVGRTVRDLRDATAVIAGASSAVSVRTTEGPLDVIDGEVAAK